MTPSVSDVAPGRVYPIVIDKQMTRSWLLLLTDSRLWKIWLINKDKAVALTGPR